MICVQRKPSTCTAVGLKSSPVILGAMAGQLSYDDGGDQDTSLSAATL